MRPKRLLRYFPKLYAGTPTTLRRIAYSPMSSLGKDRTNRRERHYVEANRIQPEDPHVLHGIAHTLYRLNRIEAAIPYYRASLRLRPNHAETHNHLGLALAKRGNLVEARQHFRMAVRLDPDYTEAKHNLAGVRKVLQSAPQR